MTTAVLNIAKLCKLTQKVMSVIIYISCHYYYHETYVIVTLDEKMGHLIGKPDAYNWLFGKQVAHMVIYHYITCLN